MDKTLRKSLGLRSLTQCSLRMSSTSRDRWLESRLGLDASTPAVCKSLGVQALRESPAMPATVMQWLLSVRGSGVLHSIAHFAPLDQLETPTCTGHAVAHTLAIIRQIQPPNPIELFLRGQCFRGDSMAWSGLPLAAYLNLLGMNTAFGIQSDSDVINGDPDEVNQTTVFDRRARLSNLGFISQGAKFPSAVAYDSFVKLRKSAFPADRHLGEPKNYRATVEALYAHSKAPCNIVFDRNFPEDANFVDGSNVYASALIGRYMQDLFRYILSKLPFTIGVKTTAQWDPKHAATVSGLITYDPAEAPRGGHAVCVVGFDDSKQAYRILNSWGPSWGSNGCVWLSYEYVAMHYVDALILLPNDENCAFGWSVDDESTAFEMIFGLMADWNHHAPVI